MMLGYYFKTGFVMVLLRLPRFLIFFVCLGFCSYQSSPWRH